MTDDQDRHEWVNVSSGTSSGGELVPKETFTHSFLSLWWTDKSDVLCSTFLLVGWLVSL